MFIDRLQMFWQHWRRFYWQSRIYFSMLLTLWMMIW